MINEQFNLLREFANWVRINTHRAASLDINFWHHNSSNFESVEYGFWVDGLITVTTYDLIELIDMIPEFKARCLLHMECAA